MLQVEPLGAGDAKAGTASAKMKTSLENIVTTAKFMRVNERQGDFRVEEVELEGTSGKFWGTGRESNGLYKRLTRSDFEFLPFYSLWHPKKYF